MAHNDSIREWTEPIYRPFTAKGEGWKIQDPAPNDTINADDFNSYSPDGSRQSEGSPRCRWPSSKFQGTYRRSFSSSRLRRILPLSPTAPRLKADRGAAFHMAVGEVWVKRNR